MHPELLIVLGKRLSDDQLTEEGISRVVALIDVLAQNTNPDLVVVFSGGITANNTYSEAEKMHDLFVTLENQRALNHPTHAALNYHSILLEKESRSTVENVQKVAEKVINREFVGLDRAVKVTFLSNDYHLQRLFEIQSWMDEQGLLRTLKEKSQQAGIQLSISYDIQDHYIVTYPHQCRSGELFLLLDNLTPYRVFLEGVMANAFARSLLVVANQPYRVAQVTLETLEERMRGETEYPLLAMMLPVLKQLVNKSMSVIKKSAAHQQGIEAGLNESEAETVHHCLGLLDSNLTVLNRYLDPEVNSAERWWKD